MKNELTNKGYFEMEKTLLVEITYTFTEADGEMEIEDLRIELGNSKNIDLFPYLPLKNIDEICEKIMENIEDEKRQI